MYSNKIWWITGASSGIGAALAESFEPSGREAVLSGRNMAALKDVAGRCKTPSLILPFEATDFANIPAHVETAWTWAQGQGGGIDGLVNNAGISQRSLAVDTVFEVYRKIVDVDLMAPIALTQALLPRMVKAGGASIVAISSVAGIAGPPLRSAYAAAKHGLIGYHDSVRAETAHLGIKVLVVAPGSVRTDVSKNALDAEANRAASRTRPSTTAWTRWLQHPHPRRAQSRRTRTHPRRRHGSRNRKAPPRRPQRPLRPDGKDGGVGLRETDGGGEEVAFFLASPRPQKPHQRPRLVDGEIADAQAIRLPARTIDGNGREREPPLHRADAERDRLNAGERQQPVILAEPAMANVEHVALQPPAMRPRRDHLHGRPQYNEHQPQPRPAATQNPRPATINASGRA